LLLGRSCSTRSLALKKLLELKHVIHSTTLQCSLSLSPLFMISFLLRVSLLLLLFLSRAVAFLFDPSFVLMDFSAAQEEEMKRVFFSF
jgi:hypothetical protein